MVGRSSPIGDVNPTPVKTMRWEAGKAAEELMREKGVGIAGPNTGPTQKAK